MVTRNIAFFLALLLLLYSLPVLALSPSPISFVVTDNIMKVTTPYYSLSLDLKQGLHILSWSIGGINVEWKEVNAVVLDLCSLNGVEKGASPLNKAEWSHEVLVGSGEVLRVLLKPKDENTCLSPLNVEVILSFYSWLPYIEIEATISNPSNETVRLVGSKGTPALSLSLPSAVGSRALLLTFDRSGLTIHKDSGVYPKQRLQSIALAMFANDSLRFIYGLSDLSKEEYSLLIFENNDKKAWLDVLLSSREISSGARFVFNFKLTLVFNDPAVASFAGLAPVYAALEPNRFKEMLEMLPLEKHMEDVKQTIESLRATNEMLEAKTKELESLVEFWKKEVKVREESLQSLETRLEKETLLVMGVAALGIVLGFFGGVLAHRAKVEHERGRIARRR
ncbi:MAG: hypothetical protein QW065_02370 [Acidilobaceae archaeon]